MLNLPTLGSSTEHPRNYFGMLKTALRTLGVSLNGKESTAYKIYSFLLIFFVNFLYSVLDTAELFKHDMEVAADMIMYPFSVVLGFAKTLVFLRSRIQFGKLLDKLEQKPFLPNPARGGETEEKLLKDCVWITTAQTLLYWITAGMTVVVGTTITLIKRIRNSDYHKWDFPFGPFTLLDVTQSPTYEICWLYQNISVTIITIHFTTYDLIMASVLAHISFQFRMLQNNMKRIVPISYENMLMENKCAHPQTEKLSSEKIDGSTIPWKYLKKSLGEAVQYHLAIIEITEEMENLLSNLLLFVFLNTLGILCFLVYHASLVSLSEPKLLISTGGALVACGQVLAICFWGEQVIAESQEVAKAAYEANFVSTDVRFQKSLIMILRRAQKPTWLTAGKFSVIRMTTFVWILRTSYSAFMMLRNVNQ